MQLHRNGVVVVQSVLGQAAFEVEVSNQGVVTGRDRELRLNVYASIDGASNLHVNVRYDGEHGPEIAAQLAPGGEALDTLNTP